MKIKFYTLFLSILIGCFFSSSVFATGEPSTYFNVFIPPNNDAVKRNVCMIISAIYDSTSFEIIDDNMDGDADDSKSGILMAGQSYILYIKDNGINDDALYASGGILKRDGDYFIVKSNKNIYVSQSTDSDWQHDWVPGISQSSLCQKFIVYASKTSSSKRDLNAFAYEDSTYVTLRKISLSSTIQTGYTNVNYQGGVVIFHRMIHRGQDLIHFYSDAKNCMDDGHTYVVESSKPITLQYGALSGNERDGGGYVPTNTGSSSGQLAYFCVPYQATGEQEIRIISWDAGNTVKLYRYSGGIWILMNNWSMNSRSVQEWVGKSNGNVSYPTVFKVECTPGKRVSIFEGNWFETGSVGTSDMATMMSSENGTTSGNYFLAYMAPPGNQANVINPFTGTLFGGRYSHLYVFSQDTANITIVDSYTNGRDFSRNYTILPGRYIDCALSELEWKNIYNGTGTTSGGSERPYLIVSSDNPVSIMNSNHNDNWMMYFGSSQIHYFEQKTTSSSSTLIPGQLLSVISDIVIEGDKTIQNVSAEIIAEGGLTVFSSSFIDNQTNQTFVGNISVDRSVTIIEYTNLPDLSPQGDYSIVTYFKGNVADAQGNPVLNNSVSNVITTITGDVNGLVVQSTSIEAVSLNSYNTSNLIFDFAENTGIETVLTDSWTVSTIDYDGDGDDDLFFTDKSQNQPNKLFKNNGSGVFASVNAGNITIDEASSVSSSWGDIDNDGDLDLIVANNTVKANFFYINNGNGSFTKNNSAPFSNNVGYYHHASWIDVDNDGQLELYLSNYWPTRFNELYKIDTNGNWMLWSDNLLSQITGSGTGTTWCDYNNDGYQDLLILDNQGGNNRMYINLGDGNFQSITNAITQHGGASVASTWGDIDNDGDMDVFIANASNQNNELYKNNGYGQFSLESTGTIVNDRGHSHGSAFADVDRDGDLDLFVANDQGIKFLYINDGTGSFQKKADEWPTTNFGKSFGSSFSDLDQDGDLDLVVATHSNQRNYIFTANNSNKKWLNIRLVGTNSNRSAIGARIRVKANGKWQMREVNSQNGFGGQNSFKQNFGLNEATTIDSLVVIWPSGYSQTLINLNVNQNIVVVEENGAKITWNVYYDSNSNCIKDNGELGLSNVKMNLNNNQVIAYSDANGDFSLHLPLGQYTINLSDNTYSYSCDGINTVSVNTLGAMINLGEIPVRPNCTLPDLAVSVSTTTMRRGFPSKYVIQTSNRGLGSADDIILTANIPVGITIDSASTDWSTQTSLEGTTIMTWNLGDMDYGMTHQIFLYYRVNLHLLPGDNVHSVFTVAMNGVECDLLNNNLTDHQTIFGSFDPNDLLTFPIGYTEHHYIDNQQELTYRIRFQNVGNYAAEFVTIYDTLPEGLDLNSIRKVVASHVYQMSLTGRVLQIYFPNIMLPDSGADLEGSNGYFEFTISQMPDNFSGKHLTNEAIIQFDYSEAIVTNQVFHTILYSGIEIKESSLVLFPNPVTESSRIYVKVLNDELPVLIYYTIYDSRGIAVYTEFCNDAMPQLNTTHLPKGVYTVQAQDSSMTFYRVQFVIIR